MAIVTRNYFICDRCHKESEDIGFLRKITVPANGADPDYFSMVSVDVCRTCAEEYKKVVFRHFAVIETHNETVQIREKEQKNDRRIKNRNK